MGIRSRVKGAIKKAVGRGDCEPCEEPKRSVAPTSSAPDPKDSGGRGNLRDGEEVPWYLKYEDADG